MLRDMFKKTYTKIDMKYRAGEKESARTAEEDAPVIPAGLWKKCNKCGKQKTVTVTRKKTEAGTYAFGISMTEDTKEGIIGTLKYSILEVRYQIKSTFLSLKYLITGRFKLNDLSGPVGIVNMIGNTYEQSIVYGIKTVVLSLLNFAIMLSANLGVMNLLPLPALDGGRLVFIILEMIRRKKVSPEKEGMVHFAGLVLLMALMVIVMANDIKNIFFI